MEEAKITCKVNTSLNTCKPYSTFKNSRKYEFDPDSDDITIVTSNTKRKNIAFTAPQSSINIPKDMTIADVGATGHFLQPGAPAINIKPTEKAISMLLPHRERIKSTYECELIIPSLPQGAKRAHIVPKLAHTSLVSIKMLCDAGCRVTYDDNAVKVFYKNIIIWKGHREPSTGLGVLPLNERPKLQNLQQIQQTETALSAYTMTPKRDLITYLHQCLFSPPKRTLLKAIHNNQLVTWPGLTTKSVSKYLDDDLHVKF